MEISSHSGTTSISTETSVSSTSNTQQHETRKRTSPSANDSGGNDVSVSATEEQPASKMPKLEGSKSEEKDAQTGDTETPVQQKTEDNENDESSDDEDEDSEEDQVEIPLKELNKQLVCPLCDQYFRDAHTITDCLHTCTLHCIININVIWAIELHYGCLCNCSLQNLHRSVLCIGQFMLPFMPG